MAKKVKEEEEKITYNVDKDKLDRYIVHMYNFNAESKRKYVDYFDRKRECAILSGFPFDETFEADVEDFLIGNNEEVNRLIIDYVIGFGSPDLILYTSYQEMLAKQASQSMTETDEKSIKVIVENMTNISEKIKGLEINLFGGVDNSLRKSLYSSQINKLRLRPEHLARSIADKNLTIHDQYYS